MPKHEVRISVLRKITVTSVIGGVTFPLTNFLFDSLTAQLIGAVSVGAITLVVTFLIDFERRLAAVEDSQREQTAEIRAAVEEGFAKVSAATQLYSQLETAEAQADAMGRLVAQAAAMEPISSTLLLRFVQTEMDRVTYIMHALGEKEATYDGEDREWLLGLTRSVTTSIDAISTSNADGGRTEFENGFWGSDLGQRYLMAQEQAVRRGVRIRRIFQVKSLVREGDHGLLTVCREQEERGIEVRVLQAANRINLATKGLIHDFILFDDTVSYDVVPFTRLDDSLDSAIHETRLILAPVKLKERMDRFELLWDGATPLDELGAKLDASAHGGRGR